MEAIILAGGMGTRLQHVVPDLPKSMAPIQGRPFLEYILNQLSVNGFQHAILSLGYLAEKISEHFGTNYLGMRLSYVFEDLPLGTGGGIRLALQKSIENHVYVFNGDTFLDLDITRIEKIWQSSKVPTVILREVLDTSRYGRVTVKNQKITGFVEKGISGSGFINAGCYILPLGALDIFPLKKPFSFEMDYLVKEVTSGVVGYCIDNGYFIDIGIPQDYYRADVELPKLFGLPKNV